MDLLIYQYWIWKNQVKVLLDSLALIWTVSGKFKKDGHSIQHSNEIVVNLVVRPGWILLYELLTEMF
jgi:hypothetical protein